MPINRQNFDIIYSKHLTSFGHFKENVLVLANYGVLNNPLNKFTELLKTSLFLF